MTNNELIELAKKKYPIGTSFKVAHLSNYVGTVISHDAHPNLVVYRIGEDGERYVHINFMIKHGISASVYCSEDDTWAEIIEKPIEIKEELLIVSYRGVHSTMLYELNEKGYHNSEAGYVDLNRFPTLYEIYSVRNTEGNVFIIDDEIIPINKKNANRKLPLKITGFRQNNDQIFALNKIATAYGISVDKIEHYIDKSNNKDNDNTIHTVNDQIELVEKQEEVLKPFEIPIGVRFKHYLYNKPEDISYLIESIHQGYVKISWFDRNMVQLSRTYSLSQVIEHLKTNKWILQTDIENDKYIKIPGLETNLEKAERLYTQGTVYRPLNCWGKTSIIGNIISKDGEIRENNMGIWKQGEDGFIAIKIYNNDIVWANIY